MLEPFTLKFGESCRSWALLRLVKVIDRIDLQLHRVVLQLTSGLRRRELSSV